MAPGVGRVSCAYFRVVTMYASLHVVGGNCHTVKHGERNPRSRRKLFAKTRIARTLQSRMFAGHRYAVGELRPGVNDEYTAASATITLATTTGIAPIKKP